MYCCKTIKIRLLILLLTISEISLLKDFWISGVITAGVGVSDIIYHTNNVKIIVHINKYLNINSTFVVTCT